MLHMRLDDFCFRFPLPGWIYPCAWPAIGERELCFRTRQEEFTDWDQVLAAYNSTHTCSNNWMDLIITTRSL